MKPINLIRNNGIHMSERIFKEEDRGKHYFHCYLSQYSSFIIRRWERGSRCPVYSISKIYYANNV